MKNLAVPAKHNPATEETQGCDHPGSVRAGCGYKTYVQMKATLSESKPEQYRMLIYVRQLTSLQKTPAIRQFRFKRFTV